jgi:asparagine synthase (glutamine-hydrolysing)
MTARAPASPPRRQVASASPYVHLRVSAGTVEVDGMPACVLGHRLATPAAGDPEGVFVEWEWNGERLLVRNDRYGCYPAYYFASPDEIAVSPSIPVLLGLGGPAELDEMALLLYLLQLESLQHQRARMSWWQ